MKLPDDLRVAIESELTNIPSKDLAKAVQALSHRYRGLQVRSSASFVPSEVDIAAYIAYRLPATFAASSAVMREAGERRPDFAPHTLLDVGGGPGTSAWAALERWPVLARATILERETGMIVMGKALATHSGVPALIGAGWLQADVVEPWPCGAADLSVAAYILGELPAGTRGEVVRRLWNHSADTCIIVEPGTPRGFEIIRQAGDELARMGVHVLAPVPHGWNCQDGPDDWCHFSERVSRSRPQRVAKGATLPYEDEKYSYLVVSRSAGLPIGARVMRHPQVRPGHIRLTLCTERGVHHVVIARSNQEAYRKAKRLIWGSAISVADTNLYLD